METVNARIKSTYLGVEDHGIPTWNISVGGNGWGQAFGGYNMRHINCSKMLFRVLEVVGVDKWEDLKGKHLRVRTDNGMITEVGNIIEDNWVNLQTFMKEGQN